MKAFLLATSLMLGGVAIAQDNPPAGAPPTTSTEGMAPGDTMSTQDSMSSQPVPTESMSTQPTPTDSMSTPPQTGAMAAPEQDSAMPAPDGSTAPPMDNAMAAPAPKADYPFCSRTVTDSCKQRNDPGNRER